MHPNFVHSGGATSSPTTTRQSPTDANCPIYIGDRPDVLRTVKPMITEIRALDLGSAAANSILAQGECAHVCERQNSSATLGPTCTKYQDPARSGLDVHRVYRVPAPGRVPSLAADPKEISASHVVDGWPKYLRARERAGRCETWAGEGRRTGWGRRVMALERAFAHETPQLRNLHERDL